MMWVKPYRQIYFPVYLIPTTTILTIRQKNGSVTGAVFYRNTIF